jgi:hypothetical protein
MSGGVAVRLEVLRGVIGQRPDDLGAVARLLGIQVGSDCSLSSWS